MLPQHILEERFWPKVDKEGPLPAGRPDLGPCWLWTAGKNERGYGIFFVGRREDGRSQFIKAHRFAYESIVGPLPDPSLMHPDHLCRTPSCVNPYHIEVVTPAVNFSRGESGPARNARRTHCVHGHEFTTENTWITKLGGRKCRACMADNLARWTSKNPDRRRAYKTEWARRKRAAAT